MNIKLTKEGEYLGTPYESATEGFRKYFEPGEPILLDILRDHTGDVIVGKWPLKSKKDKENLQTLLYGARETGQLPSDCEAVILPNGTTFRID
jgi:hypothetical protein